MILFFAERSKQDAALHEVFLWQSFYIPLWLFTSRFLLVASMPNSLYFSTHSMSFKSLTNSVAVALNLPFTESWIHCQGRDHEVTFLAASLYLFMHKPPWNITPPTETASPCQPTDSDTVSKFQWKNITSDARSSEIGDISTNPTTRNAINNGQGVRSG